MKRGKARVRTRPVTWLGLTMLAVIYAAVAFLVIDNRLGAEATARREGENLVRIIDQAYTNIFHSVDASLLVFRKAYQESPATFAIDAWAKESLIDNGLILNFTITDAQGRTVAATRVRDSSPANSIIGANFSDRDYFQNQKHAQNDELQFSEPLKLRLTGEAAVVLTRRIASASGAFAGIVAALIDPAALGKTAAGISLGAQGSFGLVGLDGIIRTRVVGGVIDINASGHKIGQAEGVLRHVNRSRTGTYWNEPGRIDNISRLISYRQLDPFPMIAMVTVSRAEVFRHANEHAVTYGTAALLLTFAILLAMRWGGERERKVAEAIDELKRAEAASKESLANLARAEAMAHLGHIKYEKASGLYTWSDGVYRIMGKFPDTFTPTMDTSLELIDPEDRLSLELYRNNVLSGLAETPITLRTVDIGGQTKYLEVWSAPLHDSSGEVAGMFGTVQDITVRKRAEEALARANQELEARVGERTAELAMEMRRREEAQMTLGQMQKMEAVGQLTAGIAHDFNNLLAVIGGSLEFVDAAAARGLTAEPELIDAALRATRRGRELVRRLLAFSRQSPLRAEATNIDQLVLDTLRLLQRTLGQGIDMVTQLDARAAVISVDRNQMANALLNLALNARDAMPDGGQLTIATTCRPAASGASSRFPMGEEVCIVISDTGVGMTDEVRSRAFEPFFTTKPDGLGSGLGLSMVQGFVEQSGGKIDIDKRAGLRHHHHHRLAARRLGKPRRRSRSRRRRLRQRPREDRAAGRRRSGRPRRHRGATAPAWLPRACGGQRHGSH